MFRSENRLQGLSILVLKKQALWRRCREASDLRVGYKALCKATEDSIRNFYASQELKLFRKGSNLKNFYNFVNKRLT